MHVLAVRIGVRTDLDGATESPGAAQIDIALFLEVRHLKIAKHADAVVVGVVVVPLVLLGVDEEEDFGETVVVVDDVPSTLLASKKLVWFERAV